MGKLIHHPVFIQKKEIVATVAKQTTEVQKIMEQIRSDSLSVIRQSMLTQQLPEDTTLSPQKHQVIPDSDGVEFYQTATSR